MCEGDCGERNVRRYNNNNNRHLTYLICNSPQHLQILLHIHIWTTKIHLHRHMRMRAHTHVHTHTHMHTHTHTHIRMRITHKHTHTHTHKVRHQKNSPRKYKSAANDFPDVCVIPTCSNSCTNYTAMTGGKQMKLIIKRMTFFTSCS